jgi:hypothetical protein
VTVLFIDVPPPPGAASDAFVFNQSEPSAVWTITHNLGRHPEPIVLTSSGDLVNCSVTYLSNMQLVLTFASAFAGVAYLN